MFAWAPYVTVDLGKLIGGRLSDQLIRQGRSTMFARKAIMAGGALCMMGGFFVVEAGSAISALAWVSLATFGFGMWSANILALHADLFDSSNIASAVEWSTAASSLGGAVFTWLTGRALPENCLLRKRQHRMSGDQASLSIWNRCGIACVRRCFCFDGRKPPALLQSPPIRLCVRAQLVLSMQLQKADSFL